MSFLDKILGRGKKAAGDLTGMASERADNAEANAQAAREQAAEHHAERSDT
jgi:hypothetical protein